MIRKLEVACFNVASAIIAQESGADRVELCANLSAGGITPSREEVLEARQKLSIDLFVMIRPRGGNFVYSDEEFEQMKKEITSLKTSGINGFVFGMLDEAGNVNTAQNTELVNLAKPLICTFHRAFDAAADAAAALEVVIACGFKTILTSGQKPNAVEGVETLAELIAKANNRITIMPGGGVRSSNISMLKEKLDTPFFHSSAILSGYTADSNEVKLLKHQLIEN